SQCGVLYSGMLRSPGSGEERWVIVYLQGPYDVAYTGKISVGAEVLEPETLTKRAKRMWSGVRLARFSVESGKLWDFWFESGWRDETDRSSCVFLLHEGARVATCRGRLDDTGAMTFS